jgi:hypothetical protein
MFPYTFEAVTAITITVLSIIIALYVVVLKRKGWLKEETSPQSLYLSPNLESTKNFQKPTKSTDLSETPPREHSACPHCGAILTASPSKIQEKPKITIEDLLARENLLKRSEEAIVPAGNQETVTSINSTEIPENPTVAVETPKPLSTEQVEASEVSKEEELPTTPSTSTEAKPQECPHYFGYLRATPKNAAMPEPCFCCPKIMECFYSKVVSQ